MSSSLPRGHRDDGALDAHQLRFAQQRNAFD